MDIKRMRDQLAAATGDSLDQDYMVSGETLRQWLECRIDQLESGELLDPSQLRRWNRVVPEEFQL